MFKTQRSCELRISLGATLALALSNAQALDYPCDELAGIAERLYGLKTEGHKLNEVHGTVQENSQGDYEKEKLLSKLAIGIFVDQRIDSVEKARKLAHEQCNK